MHCMHAMRPTNSMKRLRFSEMSCLDIHVKALTSLKQYGQNYRCERDYVTLMVEICASNITSGKLVHCILSIS